MPGFSPSPASAVSAHQCEATMSLGPLAVIGFCAAVAAVGELLQVRGGRGCCGFRRRCRHCAADRRGSQGSFELGSSASGLSACRSALPLAQLHLKLERKLFKPPTKAMARVAPPRRRCRHCALTALLPLAPACSGSSCGARRPSRRSGPTWPSTCRRWRRQRRCGQGEAELPVAAPRSLAAAGLPNVSLPSSIPDTLPRCACTPSCSTRRPALWAPRTSARRSSGWSSGSAPRASRLPSSTCGRG